MKTEYEFLSYINNFTSKKILVIGDAMLDTYLFGISTRLCREAPVPIVDIQGQNNFPGGAANTALNVKKLGAQVTFLSVVGKDIEGDLLINELKKIGVHTNFLYRQDRYQTLSKTRVNSNQQLLIRYDYGKQLDMSEEIESKIATSLIDIYATFDAIIISDYGYGVLTERIQALIIKLQRAFPRLIMVDSKYLDKYISLQPTVVKPNYQEAGQLVGLTKNEEGEKRVRQIIDHRETLLQRTGAKIVSVTLDKEGSLTISEKTHIYRTYAKPVNNAQAAGAGDTYSSAFILGLSCSGNVSLAAELASIAANITSGKEGTAFCTQEELYEAFLSKNKYITATEALQKFIHVFREKKKKIVFTNGCFDILHSGHVSYLQKAKTRGDILIVGLNSDESIKRIKGKDRPINTLSDRMHVLSSLSSIDYVIPFSENTPIRLITAIKPDIYIKGGDYTRETLPETPLVESYGGVVEIIPLVPEKSTTHIIEKIKFTTHTTLT